MISARSSAINEGIVRAHQQGIVTSTSLMTDRDAFDEAVSLAKANPKLGIGLHLDLDSFSMWSMAWAACSTTKTRHCR